MTASRLLPVIALTMLLTKPIWSQGPDLPPPFDRDAPLGEPPPVPGYDNRPNDQEQPEILGRGPLHEGFAQPSVPTPRPGPIVPKAPPELIQEIPPDEKPDGDDVIWVPGYWAWDDDREEYVWISGFWRVAPPNRKWVPGYWAKVEGGWRWVSGFWAEAGLDAVPYLPQPPASLENGPNQPAPDSNHQWIPGNWLAQDDRWYWQPGFWLAPRPGWIYSPTRFCWTPGGFVRVGGFWDRDLLGRGVPFAPVCFPQSLLGRPGFAFTPSYALNLNACLGSLWARPNWGYYAFGDFYGANYSRLGFQPWFQFGQRFNDPLFGYYRNLNVARNPAWVNNLASTYQGRMNGTLAAPPRVLAAQGRAANTAAATVVPLRDYRNTALPLVRTPANQRALIERNNSAYRQVVANRARAETQPVTGGSRARPLSLAAVPTPRASTVTRPANAPSRGATLPNVVTTRPAQRPATTVGPSGNVTRPAQRPATTIGPSGNPTVPAPRVTTSARPTLPNAVVRPSAAAGNAARSTSPIVIAPRTATTPRATIPVTPRATIPAAPRATIPAAPRLSVPNLPRAVGPVMPNLSRPSAPRFALPGSGGGISRPAGNLPGLRGGRRR